MNTSDIKCIAICMRVVGSHIYVFIVSNSTTTFSTVAHCVLTTDVVQIAIHPSLKWTFSLFQLT